MTDEEYGQAVFQLASFANALFPDDFKGSIDALCDTVAFIAAENNTPVTGADDRIAISYEAFDMSNPYPPSYALN